MPKRTKAPPNKVDTAAPADEVEPRTGTSLAWRLGRQPVGTAKEIERIFDGFAPGMFAVDDDASARTMTVAEVTLAAALAMVDPGDAHQR
jgi:hypothetical protein